MSEHQDNAAEKSAAREFTEEEKNEIIARARVYGIRDVADEVGIPWEMIRNWQRKDPPEEKKPKKEEPVDPWPEEEKLRILARADEIGIRQASEEAGVAWQRVARWGKKLRPKTQENGSEASPAARKKNEKPEFVLDDRQKEILARAEEVGVRKAAEEAGLKWQTIAWWKRRATPAGEQTAACSKETESLQEENRQLHQRIAELEKRIARVRREALKMAEIG